MNKRHWMRWLVSSSDNLKSSRLLKKGKECFDKLSMNGNFSANSNLSPFVLSLSKDSERGFQQATRAGAEANYSGCSVALLLHRKANLISLSGIVEILRPFDPSTRLRTLRACFRRRDNPSGRHPVFVVTPVKTGVHPHPRNLDTVFQRYDGRCPSPGFRLPPKRRTESRLRVDKLIHHYLIIPALPN